MTRFVTLLLLSVICAAACPGCGKSKETSASRDVLVAGRQAQTKVSAPVARTAEVTREVLTGLNLSVVQYRFNATEATIVAYTPSSQRMEVDIRREASSTIIIARGDANVDERLAISIVTEIRQRL